MTNRQKKKLYLIAVIIAGVGATTALVLNAFQENLLFFLTPTQIAGGEAVGKPGLLRLGGMVEDDSIQRLDGVRVQFAVTDFANTVVVEYAGVLPDLFREGQGVVVRGEMADGVFHAEEVLAKHDENYMPPEVKEALDKMHGSQSVQTE